MHACVFCQICQIQQMDNRTRVRKALLTTKSTLLCAVDKTPHLVASLLGVCLLPHCCSC